MPTPVLLSRPGALRHPNLVAVQAFGSTWPGVDRVGARPHLTPAAAGPHPQPGRMEVQAHTSRPRTASVDAGRLACFADRPHTNLVQPSRAGMDGHGLALCRAGL